MASATGPTQQLSSPKTKRRSPLGVGALSLAQATVPRTEEENAHGQVYRTGRARVKLHAGGGRAEWEAFGLARGGDEHASSDRGAARDPGEPAFLPGRRYAGAVLNEVLKPHVAELVVRGVGKSRGPKRRRHEAEPGEAHHRASDRLDCAGAMAHGRGVRPDETGSDGVDRASNDGRGVEGCVDEDGSDEPRAHRLQGRASIGFLGWARWPESSGIGYAPLESRTKRWAKESQIGGWFPLWSGEGHGCEGLSDCDAEPTSAPISILRRKHSPSSQVIESPTISGRFKDDA